MGSTNVTKEVVELSAIDNASKVIEGVSGAAKKLGDTYSGLASKLATLGMVAGGLASFGGFAAMIKSTIEGEAALLRLAERTGNTVEALSSLGRVAKMSNTDMDEVGKGMQKLAKSMAEAESGTGKAGKVFEALGIQIRDANTGALRPTQNVMQELGQKLMAMQDQTLAVAFAQEALGKSGANLLPFLYELARAGELQAKVTTEQAKQAKEFEDNLVKLKGASMEFWRHLANDMLPTLNKYLAQLVEGKKIFGGWLSAMWGAGTANPFKTPGEALQDVNAKLELLLAQRAAYAERGDAGLAKQLDARIAELQKMQRWFGFLRAQEIGEGMPGGAVFPGEANPKTKVANPFAGGDAGAGGKDYSQMFAVMEMQIRAYKEIGDLKKAQDVLDQKALLTQEMIAEEARKTDAIVTQAIFNRERGIAIPMDEDTTGFFEKTKKKIEETDDVARQLGLTLSSAAGEAIRHWQGFGNLLKNVMLDIGQLVLKLTVLKPMEAALEGAFKGFDWSSLNPFGGGKATGGPVMNGTSYLVGENGPEIFTPSSAGGITPNYAMGGGGTYYIDARGADPGQMARLEAYIRSVNGSIERRAMQAWQRSNNLRGVVTAVG